MSNETKITLYTIFDLQHIFNCGKNKAYKMMHDKEMKSFKIGKSYYVEEPDLNLWIARVKKIKDYKIQ